MSCAVVKRPNRPVAGPACRPRPCPQKTHGEEGRRRLGIAEGRHIWTVTDGIARAFFESVSHRVEGAGFCGKTGG